MAILPPKPLNVQYKNVISDPNVYMLEINKKQLPFYRISVVAVDKSGNPKGLVDVFYNNEYVIVSNSALGSKRKDNGKVGIGMFFKSKNPDITMTQLPAFIRNIAKPGSSSEIKKFVKQLEKGTLSVNSKLAEGFLGVTEEELKELVLLGSVRTVISLIPFLPFIAIGAFKLVKSIYINHKTESLHNKNEKEFYSRFKLNMNIPAIRTLVDTINLLITGRTPLNGVLVSGTTGSGKTFTVKKVLIDNNLREIKDYVIIRVAPDDIYNLIEQIYDARNKKLIILDDADIVLTSETHRQLLLQLLDSIPSRTVYLPRSVQLDSVEEKTISFGVDKFTVTSKFIILTNLTLNQIPDNIKTRCHIVNFSFTSDELFELISMNIENIEPELLVDKKIEVLQSLKIILKEAGIPLTFRQYIAAITYYKMYGDQWETYFRTTLKVDK